MERPSRMSPATCSGGNRDRLKLRCRPPRPPPLRHDWRRFDPTQLNCLIRRLAAVVNLADQPYNVGHVLRIDGNRALVVLASQGDRAGCRITIQPCLGKQFTTHPVEVESARREG